MNQAHLHIILVHIPILFVPLGILFYLIALALKDSSIRYAALGIFVLSAVVAFVANQLGEGAEDAVEDLVGVIKSNIHEHEEMGDKAFWLTLVLGLVSIFNWWGLQTKRRLSGLTAKFVLFIAVLSAGALTYTAYLGGKIRHPEAYEQSTKQSSWIYTMNQLG